MHLETLFHHLTPTQLAVLREMLHTGNPEDSELVHIISLLDAYALAVYRNPIEHVSMVDVLHYSLIMD